MQSRNYYNLGVSETIDFLKSRQEGLSNEQAQEYLEHYGPNELTERGKATAWAILFEQFKNFLIIILLIAVVLSAFLGEVADAVVIFVIVLLLQDWASFRNTELSEPWKR